MISSTMRGFRRSLALLATGTIMTAAHAHAQNRAALPPGAVVQPLDDGAGAAARRNLTTLADNPRSVSALNGAGRAALDMGDAEAALSFFARANEAEPRDARAKAGMAAALVRMERTREAMPLFAEAIALGAPEAEIAGDRGLAWDTLGDPRRAQADYALALRRGDDPEVRRRMALSLAISGQREAALHTIDAQLRAHDRSAWRTQAFILALTGDAAGADATARNMMPAGAEAMAPFFARLAALSPAQKAMAVHFGHFPSDGRAVAYAQADTGADPGAMAQGGPPPAASRPRYQPAEPAPPRRRPGASDDRVASLIGSSAHGALAEPVTPRRPVQTARADPPEPEPEAEPETETETEAAPAEEANAGFTLVARGEQPAARADEAPAAPRLGDLSSVLADIRDEEPARPTPARAEPRRQAQTAEARPAAQRQSARRPAPAPSRRWVQIATVPDGAALQREFARLRTRAPELLRSRSAYTVSFGRSSNRLLVGPFDNARAAQELITQLGRENVSAFAWTSEAGQEIERVQTANDSRPASTRSEPQQRSTARGAGSRSEPERRSTARTARGRSEPEPRPPARRRRSN